MALSVGATLFNSNGGGGSNFYMGRGNQDDQEGKRKRPEPEEVGELDGDEMRFGRPITRDGVKLPPRFQSSLMLGYELPELTSFEDPAEVVATLESEINFKMRLLTMNLHRMESDYARRQHAAIGEMLIGA